MFTASDALSLGLIDQVGTIEDAEDYILKEGSMDTKELKKNHPEIVAELTEEIRSELGKEHEAKIAELEAKHAADVEKALTDEKQRVAEIKAMAVVGQETIVERLIDEGATKSEAMEQLFNDLKENPRNQEAEVETPEQTALETLNNSAPAPVEQPENSEVSAYEAWVSEKDHRKQAALYAENKNAIDEQINRMKKGIV